MSPDPVRQLIHKRMSSRPWITSRLFVSLKRRWRVESGNWHLPTPQPWHLNHMRNPPKKNSKKLARFTRKRIIKLLVPMHTRLSILSQPLCSPSVRNSGLDSVIRSTWDQRKSMDLVQVHIKCLSNTKMERDRWTSSNARPSERQPVAPLIGESKILRHPSIGHPNSLRLRTVSASPGHQMRLLSSISENMKHQDLRHITLSISTWQIRKT